LALAACIGCRITAYGMDVAIVLHTQLVLMAFIVLPEGNHEQYNWH